MTKKLIEVALPLEAINTACSHEKMPGIGPHPRGIHLWWARRPLAVCRAVLFASLVDDPSSHPEQFPTPEAQTVERKRLFDLIEKLVDWNNIGKKEIYDEAHQEIVKSTNGNPPPILDPFAGGGSIPLEAQRLGLEAHASDLNPVAVLINKALIEIPPKFANKPPVNPETRGIIGGANEWKGAAGLAEDVKYYGERMRQKAFEKIGHLYPKVKVPATDTEKEYETAVIAWLWARTVQCPNPACKAQMPLISSYWLSKKKGKETWLEPVIDKKNKTVSFAVHTGNGKAPDPPKVGRGAQFRCEVCWEIADEKHIKTESMSGRMSAKLIAIVAEGSNGRIYLSANNDHENAARAAIPKWKPEQEMNRNTANLASGRGYGFFTWADLFTPRQLAALVTFSDLVGEAVEQIEKDAEEFFNHEWRLQPLHEQTRTLEENNKGLDAGGTGARAYAEAVGVYLAFVIDRCADFSNAVTRWVSSNEKVMNLFGKQAIAMTWDFPEANLFADSVGGFITITNYISQCMKKLCPNNAGFASVEDARYISQNKPIVISTDPPYYDNIGYADLSDFFYVWLRRSLKNTYPKLFSTMLVPKKEELVATPFRFDRDKKKAKTFFEDGMIQAFNQMRKTVSP